MVCTLIQGQLVYIIGIKFALFLPLSILRPLPLVTRIERSFYFAYASPQVDKEEHMVRFYGTGHEESYTI